MRIVKIGILGTGHVAGLLGGAWQQAGHHVTLGARDANASHPDLPVDTLVGAVRGAEVIVNAITGAAAVEAISAMDPAVFAGKTVVDVTNATTADGGLAYPNSSVAEHLQKALPQANVVKTMNTAAMTVSVNPSSIPGSSVFLSGDDAEAKSQTRGLLGDLGWPADAVVDLGGIESARGPEHYFLLFVELAGALKSPAFNLHIVT
jgi:predicted dinucleotide-binding enzyme